MELLRRIVRVARLDPAVYEEIEGDPDALRQALAVVAIQAAAGAFGAASVATTLALPFLLPLSFAAWFLWAFVIYLVGGKLLREPQTSTTYTEVLRTVGYAAAPGILAALGFLPFVGKLIRGGASLWMVAATVVAVRQALDYTGTGRAVAVVVASWALVYVLLFGGAVTLLAATLLAGGAAG